ncbi:MAG TPA: pyruvate ferredoxin oxidoreductase, partial [Patescibacteria group bacterium]|nr:pyruvate ferredoxin oxidoreductase [Patescibacteria group bacterium]
VKAHGVRYLAQANVAYLPDLKRKAKKAFEIKGPSFLLVFSPCTNNWKFPTSDFVKVARLATETNFWPIYEIENGKYTINSTPADPKLVAEFLKTQGRFKHLFAEKNKPHLDEIQKMVNVEFGRIAELSEN